MASEEKLERLRTERARLEGLIEQVGKEMRRAPYLAALFPLALLAWPFFGPAAAAIGILFVIALIANYVYLVGVRRREYEGELRLVERDLRMLESTANR